MKRSRKSSPTRSGILATMKAYELLSKTEDECLNEEKADRDNKLNPGQQDMFVSNTRKSKPRTL